MSFVFFQNDSVPWKRYSIIIGIVTKRQSSQSKTLATSTYKCQQSHGETENWNLLHGSIIQRNSTKKLTNLAIDAKQNYQTIHAQGQGQGQGQGQFFSNKLYGSMENDMYISSFGANECQ